MWNLVVGTLCAMVPFLGGSVTGFAETLLQQQQQDPTSNGNTTAYLFTTNLTATTPAGPSGVLPAASNPLEVTVPAPTALKVLASLAKNIFLLNCTNAVKIGYRK